MHKDLSYISQSLLTKDAGKRNQALRLDVRDCAPYVLYNFAAMKANGKKSRETENILTIKFLKL